MAIGTQYIVKLHQNPSGGIVFDSLRRVEFTHDASLTQPFSKVKFDDFPATHRDGFVVSTSYPAGSEPAASTSLAAIIIDAVAEINSALSAGSTGGGAPSAPVVYLK